VREKKRRVGGNTISDCNRILELENNVWVLLSTVRQGVKGG